jgi:hypothetical protein
VLEGWLETLRDHWKRHVELVTERPVERFLLRLFLRDARVRSLGAMAFVKFVKPAAQKQA